MEYFFSPCFIPLFHVGIPSPVPAQGPYLLEFAGLVFPYFLPKISLNGVYWFSPHWGLLVVCMGTSLGQSTVTCFDIFRCVKVHMLVCLVLC